MTLSLLFWICMLLWLVFGVNWPAVRGDWRPAAGTLLLFLMLLALGWRVFGAPIQ